MTQQTTTTTHRNATSASSDLSARIASWLGMLADVTAAGHDPVSAERIATMAALLAKDGADLPAEAYTSDSLHHVACQHRWFPSYAEVRDGLLAWWRDHRPASSLPTLPGIDIPESLSAVDRGWMHWWHKRRGEVWASALGQAETEREMAHISSLVRTQSPKAWAVIRGPETGIPVPSEAVVAAVTASLEAHRAEMQARRVAVDAVAPAVPALRDVSIKGPALQAMRERRGKS